MFNNEKGKAVDEIVDKIKIAPIVIFMRGDANEPKCKASKLLMECFFKMEIDFKSFDILKDDSLKEWLKQYSNWPCFPQVFI